MLFYEIALATIGKLVRWAVIEVRPLALALSLAGRGEIFAGISSRCYCPPGAAYGTPSSANCQM